MSALHSRRLTTPFRMLFPTVEYALFFLLSLIFAWGSVRWHAAHKVILLLLSYVFYGFWNWYFVPLLFGISVLAWAAARGIQQGSRPQVFLGLGVASSLGILAYFKYSAFFLQTLVDVLAVFHGHWGVDISSPFLPLGVSFMCFHAISLMMDAYRGKLDARVPFGDALLYVAFFPQLIAGPILRASAFLPQLRHAPDPARIQTARALMLIVGGLFKKVVIANTLSSLLVDDVFANPAAMSASQTLLGIYGYAAQIYCDFSGYTDIAIGCALLLGYRFPLNFNAPYTATSPQEFWRRWHISLSSWLRDYLYIPLGGSRGGRGRMYWNLLITMVLGGLWHGAAWNFVMWGALHGGLLIMHREWDRYTSAKNWVWRETVAWRWAARFLLFNAVCLAWVFFRCESFSASLAVLGQLGQGAWQADLPLGPLLCVIAGVGVQYLPSRIWLRLQGLGMMCSPALRGAVFASLLMLIEVLGPSEPAPFIYFQF